MPSWLVSTPAVSFTGAGDAAIDAPALRINARKMPEIAEVFIQASLKWLK
jgi:hypothetical protein